MFRKRSITRARKWTNLIGLIAFFTGSFLVSAQAMTTTAGAADCGVGMGHCYSIVETNTSSTGYGSFAQIYVENGAAPDWSWGGFLTEELWVFTGDSDGYWVESGYIYGSVSSNGYGAPWNYVGPGPNWFWADERPDGTYHTHVLTSFGSPLNFLGDPVDVSISYEGSSEWNVYIGGVLAGVSTSNPCCSYDSETGGEAYTFQPTSYLDTTADTNLAWQASQGAAWTSCWPPPYAEYLYTGTTGAWWVTGCDWLNSYTG